jgi:hypothetical protein
MLVTTREDILTQHDGVPKYFGKEITVPMSGVLSMKMDKKARTGGMIYKVSRLEKTRLICLKLSEIWVVL